ncbi:stimulus-sensing domain-containing protein [Caulobacter sp. KR2-114]|uniref:stimulus-sensing domain-containing protein n=1 Tax=Caulobacter sp. KR2-114 TaxID=3400912 RepID=UPI003BFCCB69
MASAIATAKSDEGRGAERPRRGVWPIGSRLGRLIITLNLLALIILVGGALVLNELRRGLVNARIESLTLQGQVIANVIDQTATVGEPEPSLEADTAANVLQSLFIPRTQRVRLFDSEGHVLADSYVVADRVESSPLPPAKKPGEQDFSFDLGFRKPTHTQEAARQALASEVGQALRGVTATGMRVADNGRRVVSVSIPITHVRAVLGVLTLEAGDVDEIIAAERAALIPFALVAMGVTLLSSIMLTQLIARPIMRLASAADRVRLSRARAIDLPDLAERQDEIGDLTRSLTDMTRALSDRIDAIERFAADVAHEIRNPLTSIRSATETLELVSDDAPRERLMRILKNDVGRLDRLITDISNASRLDAELARESPRPLDLEKVMSEIAAFYEATLREGETHVRFRAQATPHEPLRVQGREGPLGQVFRNLIDNARSFSPPGGEVRVSAVRQKGEVLVTVEDDGPGMPPDNLETVFERFYTSRPKGAAFGGNSGLGLSIARQIVEAHNGRIWAENREQDGQVIGARFSVALPAA